MPAAQGGYSLVSLAPVTSIFRAAQGDSAGGPGAGRLCLHAASLSLPAPLTAGRRAALCAAPLPAHMREAMLAAGLDPDACAGPGHPGPLREPQRPPGERGPARVGRAKPR